MAIYLSRKKGGVTPTSITPSNSSPAALTANSAVTPTANGYAIQSYDDIYPGLVAQMIEDGEIYLSHGNMYVIHNQPITIYPSNTNPRYVDDAHIYYEIGYGSGYVIEDYYSVTPSSTPETVSAGNMVQINGSGVIVDSIPTPTSITPSDSSPVALSANTPVNPTTSGYAISSYSSKTPSDSSPASVSSGAIIKASASGYLYATQQPKVATGTFTMSSTAGTVQTVTLGFKPKYIIMYNNPTGTPTMASIYDENFSTTKWIRCVSSGVSAPNIGNTQNFNINSITNTGFTTKAVANANVGYTAIG